MKKSLLLVAIGVIFVTVLAAGCTSNTSPNSTSVKSSSSQNTVVIKNLAYSPAALTIQKGASVTWRNDDSVQHSVVSDTGAFTSPTLNQGDTYTHQFTATGTFSYHCMQHPFMKGSVVVQ